MRRVRYSVVTSLDGYIAGPKGEADWITAGSAFGQRPTKIRSSRRKRPFEVTSKTT